MLFMTGFTLLPRGPPRRGLLLSFHHRIGVVLGLGLLIGNWVPPVSSLFCHVVQGGDAPSLLSVFEKLHNLKSYLCLGSVGNGLKFCMLGASQYSFVTHSKRLKVIPDALYLGSSRNSTFSHHFIEKALLSTNQLEAVLQERHSKEEWVLLFHLL